MHKAIASRMLTFTSRIAVAHMTKEDRGFSRQASPRGGHSGKRVAILPAPARTVAVPDSGNEFQRLIVDTLPDAILLEFGGVITLANPAAATLFGAQSEDQLLGKSWQALAGAIGGEATAPGSQSGADDARSAPEEQTLLLERGPVDVEVTRLPVRYRGQSAVCVVVRNITERKRLDQRLQHQATHDALTGLPNRTLLVDRLRLAIADARRHKARFVVAFVDLDRFKWINDSFGHDAGDMLLKTVSRRMSDCLRESDTIARIGGDEFVLVLREAGSSDDPMQVLDRLVACVSRPLTLAGSEITVTCSMGYCTYPDDGDDPESLLQRSDAAMYRAKELGRNNMQRYTSEVQHRFDERVAIAAELRHAIERNQFALHYQLQLDLETGAITGLEALLRWQHPTLGNVAPGRFLPIAEETGLIEPISDWVIRQACMQNKRWQDAGLAPVRVAVNLSARELTRPDLDLRVSRFLADARLDPAYLELELTESASMDNPDKTLSIMHKLKDLGIRLSIDNFGTGYSNMQYLKRFPVERLKLDGSCTREIATNPDSFAVTNAVVSAAHQLGMKVVAEMAETESQVAMLAACGCDQVQGHYFSMPVSADECAELLRVGSIPLQALALKHAALPH